jgi:hypothetical protein
MGMLSRPWYPLLGMLLISVYRDFKRFLYFLRMTWNNGEKAEEMM